MAEVALIGGGANGVPNDPAHLADRYLTPTQAAKLLGVSRIRIHQMIQGIKTLPENRLKVERVGNQYLIPKRIIEKLLQKRKV